MSWLTTLAGIGFLLASPLQARAFTLQGSSALQGWDTDTLTFRVNASDCLISESELNTAIDAAVGLWNSVPTSDLRLERGETVSTTSAEASAGDAQSDFLTPLVICDPDLSTTIGSSADYIPASTAIKANGMRVDYAVILLNAESGASANIGRLDPEKLAIVLAHEMGHVLGLGHTRDARSLMYFDATERRVLSLSQDDMDGVTYLYPRHELGSSGFLGCGTLQSPRGGSGGGAEMGSGGGEIPSGLLEILALFGACGLMTAFARRFAA